MVMQLLQQPSQANNQPAPQQLDFSFAQSKAFFIRQYNVLEIVVVGLGGTGSWVAPGAARIARTLMDAGKRVKLKFVDFDHVEQANVLRQNFAYCEIGLPKALTLAARYNAAWGLDIEAHLEPFKASSHVNIGNQYGLTLIVGCVDNANARLELMNALNRNTIKDQFPQRTTPGNERPIEPPNVLWLDAGNSRESGQVFFGTHNDPGCRELKKAFELLPGYCFALPSPALQDESLLVARPEEAPGAEDNMSCEQIALMNAQSLMVNQRVAAEVSDFMLRLLVSQNLRRFQTYFDLPTGAAKSTYITPESVAKIIRKQFED
jgi:PRTRC genetic system ThiF family protein